MLNILTFIILIISSFLNCSIAFSEDKSLKDFTVSRNSRTDTILRLQDSKHCTEYLSICEKSCIDRGDMFKFCCIGKNFQPFEQHYLCICGDDIFVRKEFSKQEHTPVKR